MKRFLTAGLVLALAAPAVAEQVSVDSGIPPYQKTSGVSGNINSVGSDTMNNLMTLWAEAFIKMYPNVKVQADFRSIKDEAANSGKGATAKEFRLQTQFIF